MPLPAIGQVLRVHTEDEGHTVLISRMLDLTPEFIRIDVPSLPKAEEESEAAETPPTVAPGTALWVEFHARDGALCKFRSELLLQEPLNGRPTWRIPVPEQKDIIREQRREFVRVPADLPVQVSMAPNADAHEVYTQDLSGGGLSLRVPPTLHLSAGTDLVLTFQLPPNQFTVTTPARVVRVGARNDHGYAIVSCRFVNMDEKLRQRVIQYTFYRQRQILASLSK
ncbi:PilZ domain-containing protein [Alicyclobacillus cycloheptanicus]|uniref:C-di-GMP-binding flagellar brake protein YcgR n=1 Tax=Alicyclobacillus cycloheptanicus TaxID=1457 RepID=A0ABT9XEC0_9BACL|nr:PilZ domain-containing protein [Alicyclobacillus cycloheptanicus]MDQ0188480.1 c-di-GMP-binding flagellar brake protein YcgR [Alicyclobacillus cycloheptanicus]WDM01169.1 PilZ domain-containing protein [Alicyclobacillus cycloheptanicus]